MIGHQRDVLSALGIDLWIPRETLCQNRGNPQIWRDQAATEIITTLAPPQQIAPVDIQKTSAPSLLPDLAPNAVVVPVPPESNAAEILQPALDIASFTVQAAVLKHCLLLINATVLTEQEQLLWANIQRAVLCDFVELQWPFPWQNAQNGRGAASYLSGFVDAHRSGQAVVAIGEIPYLESSECIQLASLSAMLEQPLLKKRLWQFMQNKPDLE